MVGAWEDIIGTYGSSNSTYSALSRDLVVQGRQCQMVMEVLVTLRMNHRRYILSMLASAESDSNVASDVDFVARGLSKRFTTTRQRNE